MTEVNAYTATGEEIPTLVEVEIDGKKFKIEEGAKESLMKGKDYTQKTQALAEERRKLEAEKATYQSELDSARGVLGYLNSDETAAKVLEAIISGDKKKAASLLAEDGGGDDVATLKRKVEELDMKLKVQDASNKNAAQRTAEYADAKRRLKELDIDLDAIYPAMVERGTKDKNAFVPWAIATALEDIKQKAKDEGRKLAKQDAIEELSFKLDNTPPTSSGKGGEARGKKSNQLEAIASALNRIQEEKARQSMS